jgi:hypothetical protein
VRSLLATAGLLALAGAAAAQPPIPHTLRRSGSSTIAALAQDGGLVAWLSSGGRKCNAVHMLVDGKTDLVPSPAAGSMTCHWDLSDERPQLALAARGSAALWTLHEKGPYPVDYVLTARVGGPERRVDRLAHADNGTGTWLGSVAGDGSTLAYSWVDVEYVDKISCLSGGVCRRRIADGGIHLVSSSGVTPLAGAGPALQLASAAGRLAYIPASKVEASGEPAATASAEIEVVDATSGAAVCAVSPRGVPLAIGLAPDVLAVLTRKGIHDRVSWYDTRDGTPLGSVVVPRRTAPQLVTNNRIAIYRVGRSLHGIVLRTGRSRQLATITGTPVGLTLEGGRLVWAENRGGTGRIQMLTVG